MAPPPAERIDVLAVRVRWLDRRRHAVSIALAVVLWLFLAHELAIWFGATSWNVISVVVGAMFAAVGWWVIEAFFAGVIAMWETEYDRLARDQGLPRAELLRGGDAYRDR